MSLSLNYALCMFLNITMTFSKIAITEMEHQSHLMSGIRLLSQGVELRVVVMFTSTDTRRVQECMRQIIESRLPKL